MGLEQLKSQIRTLPGESPNPTFYKTDPINLNGLFISYLVVDEGDNHGLDAGIYVETSVSPESYSGSLGTRLTIRQNVMLSLIQLEQARPLEPKTRHHTVGVTQFMEAALAPNGALVLRVLPTWPTETT